MVRSVQRFAQIVVCVTYVTAEHKSAERYKYTISTVSGFEALFYMHSNIVQAQGRTNFQRALFGAGVRVTSLSYASARSCLPTKVQALVRSARGIKKGNQTVPGTMYIR